MMATGGLSKRNVVSIKVEVVVLYNVRFDNYSNIKSAQASKHFTKKYTHINECI